ncbi:unnamed protein product [Dovyalis caffra]|uniref:Uncharacterized protein n=1 Tax=Dovyalis caffra TaxID=77055 RepID=A0AAV1SCG0_9ROSI|nr:unnamed protein product [Dovyalis caffra]
MKQLLSGIFDEIEIKRNRKVKKRGKANNIAVKTNVRCRVKHRKTTNSSPFNGKPSHQRENFITFLNAFLMHLEPGAMKFSRDHITNLVDPLDIPTSD